MISVGNTLHLLPSPEVLGSPSLELVKETLTWTGGFGSCKLLLCFSTGRTEDPDIFCPFVAAMLSLLEVLNYKAGL